MKTLLFILALIILQGSNSIHQFTMEGIEGKPVDLGMYKGKVILVVNVASECGNTPQYKDLQALYEQKRNEGLVILGFPANDFGAQEPGTNEEIHTFCTANYGVTFPMFAKISVKGRDMHPLYRFLTEKAQNGVMDTEVKWNFQKYLLDKNGVLKEVIEPRKSVTDKNVMDSINALLTAG